MIKEDRKRKSEENEEEDFVVGNLDGSSSSEEEADEEEEEEVNETFPEEKSEKEKIDSDGESDSEAELNALLAEEEGESGSENESDLESIPELEVDSGSINSGSVLSDSGYEKADSLRSSVFSDGRQRILKPEIDPVYDSDDSDAGDFNTIGNIPISAYDEMPHLGYDINGKRIMRPAKGSALDALLDQIDLPEGWTGLLDPHSGNQLNLSKEEVELIKKIQRNEKTDDSIDPFEPTIEWFTSRTETMPLLAAPEPKRRFAPSKHEAKRVMKMVRAIREGKIVPGQKRGVDDDAQNFDLWENDGPELNHELNLKAPKLPPPTNEESYNPPEEYLPNDHERHDWENKDPLEKRGKVLPQKYSALRKVPAYPESVRERFDRCLDLYLAPRVRQNKLSIDPDSLVPELPSPRDLRPFPLRCSTIYKGHSGRIRTVSISPSGLWLATGADDGSVRIWEILSGRQVFFLQAVDIKENPDDKIDSIDWHPDSLTPILAIAASESILLVVPPIFGFDLENDARNRIESGWGYATFGQREKSISVAAEGGNGNDDADAVGDNTGDNVGDNDGDASSNASGNASSGGASAGKWLPPSPTQSASGISAIIECSKPIKKLSWHRKGDYFVTVSPEAHNSAVLIHQLSKHLSQSPFRRNKGITMDAKFHPFKPLLFVASQRAIRVYDLAQQLLSKKLQPGARLLSTIDIHPRGDHLLASSYDKRVLWHDLDLGATPYKTMRYHEKAVRSVSFHKGSLPLFATASDDGSIHVFHATVYDDYMTNPLLVPLKKLTGHKVVESIGVLDLVWHPKEPWLFTAGADGTARLWTS